MRPILHAAAALLLSGAALRAQQPVVCRPDRTIGECREAAIPTGSAANVEASRAEAAAAANAAADRRLKAKHAGPDLPSGPSAIRDFLPRFSAALLTPATGGGPGDVGVRLKVPLGDSGLFTYHPSAQVGVVMHRAELPAALANAIPAGRRAEATDRLSARLGAFDDVSLTGAVNLENRRLGRNIVPHQKELSALLSSVLVPAAFEPSVNAVDSEYMAFALRLQAAVQQHDPSVVRPERLADPDCMVRTAVDGRGRKQIDDVSVGCLTPWSAAALQQQVAAVAEARSGMIGRMAESIRASGFEKVSQLLNNQPQLNVTAEYRGRRAVAGSSEWTGSARWETGFANLNGLRAHCPGLDADCLRSYTDLPRVKRALAHADRVWAQVDYHRRSGWSVDLPRDSVHLSRGPGTSYDFSSGYGAYYGNPQDGENRDRVDLEARLRMVRDDPLRQDRFVASATYTHRLGDQSAAVFGFRYASRPEFLGEVDHRFGANLGMTYKVNAPGKR